MIWQGDSIILFSLSSLTITHELKESTITCVNCTDNLAIVGHRTGMVSILSFDSLEVE